MFLLLFITKNSASSHNALTKSSESNHTHKPHFNSQFSGEPELALSGIPQYQLS